MLSRIMNGGVDKNYIYVDGEKYEFKTGNTGTQSTYGVYRYCDVPSNIIPITLYVNLQVGRPQNAANTAEVVDNNGTKYFDASHGGGTGSAIWFTSYAYISCILNKSFDYAKNITKFTAQSRNGVSNLYICAWLEKVGGAIAKLLSKLSCFFRKEVALC